MTKPTLIDPHLLQRYLLSLAGLLSTVLMALVAERTLLTKPRHPLCQVDRHDWG